LAKIGEQIQEFVNFILQYVNDTNPAVVAISLKILNLVLAKASITKQFKVKALVPMLVKRYAEKSVVVRKETTKVF